MDYQPRTIAGTAPAGQNPAEIYGALVNCLGRAVKCVSLYGASHPLSVDYLKESLRQLGLIASRTRCDRLVLTLSAERLLVNGVRASETAQARAILKEFFQAYDLTSLTILAAVSPAEFSVLCELASSLTNSPLEKDLRALLKKMGVTHILCENVSTEAENEPKPILPEPGPRPAPTSAPQPAPQPALQLVQPSAPARKSPAFSFGSLLKTLVESAATNTEDRLQLYQEAAGLVKEAMDRRVDEATKELHQEKLQIAGEQARAEHVLAAVADGKVIVDKDGKVLMMNAAAEYISGKRLIDMVGKHITHDVDPDMQMVAISKDLVLPPDGQVSKEIRVIAQEEVEFALRRSLALVQDDEGRLVGTYSMLPDIAKYKETQRMQEEFLSRITHDLKAPLASISCGLEMISTRMGPRMAPEETNFVEICLKNARQLGLMINGILDFSKLESGQMTVHPIDASVALMLAETIESLMPWAATRRISLCAAPVLGGLMVRADPVRIVQILTNLGSNAIKSTPEAGRIVIAARSGSDKGQDCAIFSVKDTGCGIRKEHLAHIFDKFFQVEETQGRREGVGLGLTIVQELVAQHHGRVWVESTVGEGSTFFFSIPLTETPGTEEISPMEPQGRRNT